jgi:hypothetical protein
MVTESSRQQAYIVKEELIVACHHGSLVRVRLLQLETVEVKVKVKNGADKP